MFTGILKTSNSSSADYISTALLPLPRAIDSNSIYGDSHILLACRFRGVSCDLVCVY